MSITRPARTRCCAIRSWAPRHRSNGTIRSTGFTVATGSTDRPSPARAERYDPDQGACRPVDRETAHVEAQAAPGRRRRCRRQDRLGDCRRRVSVRPCRAPQDRFRQRSKPADRPARLTTPIEEPHAMNIDMDVVQLSRLQFGLTAMYHFLFIPLTLGLAVLLGVMESVYVMTGRDIWRRMTKFWGMLFGINFAMGVATGITMEFQFGMNWAYYSHYVGDIFGAPLAIEGLMAFFLEATFIGLFFFGWDKLTRLQHLCVTWLVALGSNLSALWILIANGWMQYPVGAKFNPDTMRMEVTDFMQVLFNPVAQAKFVHTVSAGYVTGAMFVLSISAFYLIRGRHTELAKRSMTVAASFGLAAALSVVVLGDESGYTAGENQKMKIAAIEAMWDTEPAPASFTLFGMPDLANRRTNYEVKVPWMLGLIATRSIDKTLPGIKELVAHAEQRIKNGLVAYDALEKLR